MSECTFFHGALRGWVFCESRHQKENSTCARSVGSSYQMPVEHSSLHTAWIAETLNTLYSHILEWSSPGRTAEVRP